MQAQHDAADCIRGSYSADEQEPDDFGRATRPGFRNINKENRTFGCPSVRTDRRPPKRRSLADGTSYGDEGFARELLWPSRFADLGVDESHFVALRPKEEVRQIFDAIGVVFPQGVFEGLWDRAQDLGLSRGQGASVHAFRTAMNEYDDSIRDRSPTGEERPAVRRAWA